MSLFYDQLDLEYSGETRRKAFRIAIPGLKVLVMDWDMEFKATDISAGGVSFSLSEQESPYLSVGQEILISLTIDNKLFLQGLRASVVKAGKDFAACRFVDIPLRQEALLDKLVLEMQKNMIELKRKQRLEEEADEKK